MAANDWLACENPNHALDLLWAAKNRSRRKDRLAAAAGLRHFWAELSAEQRRAVTAAERYADGGILLRELRAAAVRVGGGRAGRSPVPPLGSPTGRRQTPYGMRPRYSCRS
jgi:hypothetical protein